jgi:hypothetical protein
VTAEQIRPTLPASSDHIIGSAGGFNLIDYSAMVERMVIEFPSASRHDIEAIAVREHEAMIGARPLAVPDLLELGVREHLAPLDPMTGEAA